MFSLDTLMILIPGLPLLACIVTAIFGKHVLRERSHLPTVIAIIGSFICSLPVLFTVRSQADAHGSSLVAHHAEVEEAGSANAHEGAAAHEGSEGARLI